MAVAGAAGDAAFGAAAGEAGAGELAAGAVLAKVTAITETNEKIADRVNINMVKAFSCSRTKNKRFLN